MPSYSYRCDRCGHELEVLKRMDDANTVEFCPGDRCKGIFQPMDRLYNSVPAARVVNGTPRFHRRKVRQG